MMNRRVCSGRITSPFGQRYDPISKALSTHNGVDIGAAVGTAVYAPQCAEVMAAFTHHAGGRTLILRAVGESGLRFGMCHLSRIFVQVGQVVAAGEKVAATGNTGRSTGPHLHFSVKTDGRWVDGQYVGGRWVDPEPYLQIDEG